MAHISAYVPQLGGRHKGSQRRDPLTKSRGQPSGIDGGPLCASHQLLGASGGGGAGGNSNNSVLKDWFRARSLQWERSETSETIVISFHRTVWMAGLA